jgi:hypothetical protein
MELVDLVVQGHPGAFRQFYQRHSQLIYGCIRKRANGADVDEVFQAFFERLTAKGFRSLRLSQRGTSLVRNFVIDFYRAKRSREEAIGGAAELDALLELQEETLSLQAHLNELRHLGIQARAAFDELDRAMICGPSRHRLSRGNNKRRCLWPVAHCKFAMQLGAATLTATSESADCFVRAWCR